MVYQKLANTSHSLQANEFFYVMLEHSRNMIFVKDEQFRIVYANPAFLDMYDPDIRDKIVGTTTIEKFSEEEAAVFLREDQKAFETGYAELTEELTDYQGVKRSYQTRKIRFIDKQGRVMMLGVCNDITQWAEREKKLAKNNLALENFAALAAHDLRSPLGAFISGIELVRLDKETKISSSSHSVLEMMKTSAEGLIAQIGNLLSAYKSSESNALKPVMVDVSPLVEEVKFNLSHLIERDNARVLSNSLPVIRADKILLRQLLHNLIENSLKYQSDEKPIIIVRYEKQGSEHVFSVEDNGRGIQQDNVENIFKLYAQADDGFGGVGIGLTLCKKIVDMHHGKIWVDKSHRSGCKICFTMPE